MEQNFYSLLTDIGKAKIANAAAFGNKINLTKFIVGDGAGGYYEITESQKKLKNKIWEGKINSLKQMKDNPNWLELECIIPADVGGFMIRELGVIDDKENLIVICKYPETYKPLLSNGCAKELRCKIIIEISNATSNVLQIDSTVLLATQDDITDIKEQFNTNKKNTDEKVNKLNSQCEDFMKEITSLQQTDFYIDEKNGTDTNNGTENNPVKTSKKAFQLMKRCSSRPTLHLLSDITNDNHFYFENISLIIDGNNQVIYGEDSEGINLVFCDCYVKNIELKNCRFYVQHSNIHIENFKHNKSRSNMFYSSNVKIFNCSFENPTYWSITIDKNSNFQGYDLNFSNCESCISIGENSYASLYNCLFKNITQSNITTSHGGVCDIRK